MIKLLQEINLTKQLSEQPQLLAYIKQAAKQIEQQQSEQMIKFKKPIFDEDMQNHLIVTGIPDVKEQAKEQAFYKFFNTKILDAKGIGKKQGLQSLQLGYKIVDGKRVYNRTMYMIYKNSAIAKKAYQKLHNLKASSDNFRCFTVKQFKDFSKINKDYTQPKSKPKNELISYNLDELQRDQLLYTVTQNNRLKLFLKWVDHIEKKVQQAVSIDLAQGANYVYFSSKGTYVAVCQPNGVRILQGNNLQQKGFYEHNLVTNVKFSPKQTYMITHNGNPDDIHQSFAIWAVQSNVKLFQVKAYSHQSLESFQFNSDQSSIAIGLSNEFVVYRCDTPQNFKKHIKMSYEELANQGKMKEVPNLQKLVWLPDKVSVTCVCYQLNPSIHAHPTSKILSYNTETKQQKKWKAIGQNIKDAQVTVSANNDWISVFFKKIYKKNQSTSVIYIVNLLKRDIQTDIVQFKENVVSVSWDKNNARFGVVYEIPNAIKNQDVRFGVNFYQIETVSKVQHSVKFGQIDMTPCNSIILSGNGTFFALYNTDNFSWGKYKYSLGIFTKDQKSKKMTIQLIKKNVQIPYMTYFDMDQSGRFILTGTDKAYQIWTTSGQLINKDMFSIKMSNAYFRPRFVSRLATDAENKLQQREKEIRKIYQQEDKKRLNAIEYEKKKQREQKKQTFSKYLVDKRNWFKQYKPIRDKFRGFNDQDPSVKSAVYQYSYLQRS